ncbi:MAG: hypothetical protein ACLU9S_12455 [Oscillospiraceae bacterium]
MDEETVDAYYQEGAALFTVTIDEDKRLQAVADIRTLIGDENAMTGSAVSTAIATTSTVSEIAKIAAFVVLFVLVVLLIANQILAGTAGGFRRPGCGNRHQRGNQPDFWRDFLCHQRGGEHPAACRIPGLLCIPASPL